MTDTSQNTAPSALPAFKVNTWYQPEDNSAADDRKEDPATGYPVVDAPPPYQYQDDPDSDIQTKKASVVMVE